MPRVVDNSKQQSKPPVEAARKETRVEDVGLLKERIDVMQKEISRGNMNREQLQDLEGDLELAYKKVGIGDGDLKLQIKELGLALSEALDQWADDHDTEDADDAVRMQARVAKAHSVDVLKAVEAEEELKKRVVH